VRNSDALSKLRSDALTVKTLDATDWDAIDALSHCLATPVDRLFAVAGIAGPSDVSIGNAGPDEFTKMMLVNALAPLRIIDRWDGLVAKRGLVAVMSSSQASIGLNDDGGKEAYRMSKAALNMGCAALRHVAPMIGPISRSILAGFAPPLAAPGRRFRSRRASST